MSRLRNMRCLHNGANNRHKRWIKFCLKKARSSKVETYKHCAVLIRGGKPVSVGINKVKAGCLGDEVYGLCGWHAELDALCNIPEDTIRKSILYFAGWSKGNNIVTSKPCPKCQEYISKFDLKAVYYSLPDGGYEQYK